MKKYILPIIIVIIFIVLVAYFYFYKFDLNNSLDYNADKMSTEIENNNIMENKSITLEKEISSFFTKIIDKNEDRDINIDITCNEINGIIIKNGDEFSFNKIAGNPTPERGYKKAGIFIDGELKKGYGGGNCQVSTTIYNAVLKINGIKITERHEHGKEVGYIEMGKDSTVVYDDLDLKFENNTGYDIKIYTELSNNKVNVRVMKLQ